MSGKINKIASVLLAAGMIAVLFSGVAAAANLNDVIGTYGHHTLNSH